jgi:hypothetical protein
LLGVITARRLTTVGSAVDVEAFSAFTWGEQSLLVNYFGVYRTGLLGQLLDGNHAATPSVEAKAVRTADGVRWPCRSTSHCSL